MWWWIRATRPRGGATGASGRVEYQYNLVLSGAVAARLTALGERVKRVAADGAEVSLGQRSRLAPDADFFISIHHDSMQQKYIDAGRQREFAGFSIFVSQRNPRYEESLRCAKAIGEALVAAGEKPSLYHAEPIAGENRPLLDRRLGVHRFDGLAVLKTATMPAVLVEAGVIVNPDDEARWRGPIPSNAWRARSPMACTPAWVASADRARPARRLALSCGMDKIPLQAPCLAGRPMDKRGTRRGP